MPPASQKTQHSSLLKQKRVNLPSILRFDPSFCPYPCCPFTSSPLLTSNVVLRASPLKSFLEQDNVQTHSSQQVFEALTDHTIAQASFFPQLCFRKAWSGENKKQKNCSWVLTIYILNRVLVESDAQRPSGRGSIIWDPA